MAAGGPRAHSSAPLLHFVRVGRNLELLLRELESHHDEIGVELLAHRLIDSSSAAVAVSERGAPSLPAQAARTLIVRDMTQHAAAGCSRRVARSSNHVHKDGLANRCCCALTFKKGRCLHGCTCHVSFI